MKVKQDAFFDNVVVLFQNLMMSYFVSEALDQYEIVFDIIKAIVKIIIDDILYSVEDKIYNNDNDIKHDED